MRAARIGVLIIGNAYDMMMMMMMMIMMMMLKMMIVMVMMIVQVVELGNGAFNSNCKCK